TPRRQKAVRRRQRAARRRKGSARRRKTERAEMTALWLATLLVVFLLLAGMWGPRLLRRAAPALAQVPRLAITLLVGSAALWLLAALAVGPVLAWGSNGPSLLGGSAGAVCRRCLASADPFEGTGALSEVRSEERRVGKGC